MRAVKGQIQIRTGKAAALSPQVELGAAQVYRVGTVGQSGVQTFRGPSWSQKLRWGRLDHGVNYTHNPCRRLAVFIFWTRL